MTHEYMSLTTLFSGIAHDQDQRLGDRLRSLNAYAEQRWELATTVMTNTGSVLGAAATILIMDTLRRPIA